MELRNLRALITVAETGSVTKAAQFLHLVQPAVTRQIRSLEEDVGVPLFERTNTGMRPTPAGHALVARARRVLTELERARAEIQPEPGHVTGIAAVGLLASVQELLAPRLVEVVARKYPGIELQLASAYSGHLQEWLDAGDLDVSLLYNLTSTQSVRVLPLLRDQLWAVAPAADGLRIDEPVDFATVIEHPFILPIAGKHGLRILIDEALSNCDITPRIAVRANSMSLQKSLVKAGYGWTILPATGVVEQISRNELSAAPLSKPSIARTVALGLRRIGRTPPAVRVVAAELLTLVRVSVASGHWPSAQLINDSDRSLSRHR